MDITPQKILAALNFSRRGLGHAYLSTWPTLVCNPYSDYDYVETEPIKPLITEVSKFDIQLADIGAGQCDPRAFADLFAHQAIASWKDQHLTEWIQPDELRAPTVLTQAR